MKRNYDIAFVCFLHRFHTVHLSYRISQVTNLEYLRIWIFLSIFSYRIGIRNMYPSRLEFTLHRLPQLASTTGQHARKRWMINKNCVSTSGQREGTNCLYMLVLFLVVLFWRLPFFPLMFTLFISSFLDEEWTLCIWSCFSVFSCRLVPRSPLLALSSVSSFSCLPWSSHLPCTRSWSKFLHILVTLQHFPTCFSSFRIF